MSKMKQILKEWRDYTLLNESSLSRVYRHIQEHDCVIITAFRDDTEDKTNCTERSVIGGDNKERNRDLKATLLGLGYGVTAVDGSYVEDFGSETAKEVKEDSLFCVNLKDDPSFVETMAALGEKFCQDSIIVFPKGGESVYLRGTNNASFPGYGSEQSVGDFVGGKEAEFMTRVKGRPFTTKESLALETYDNLTRLQKMSVRASQKKILGN